PTTTRSAAGPSRRLPDDRPFVVDVHYLIPSFSAHGDCINPVLVADDPRHIRGIRNMRFPDHSRLYRWRKRGELNVISLGNWTYTNAGTKCQSYGSNFVHDQFRRVPRDNHSII